MRVEQASEIARFLGVPVADVMRHGGATNVVATTEAGAGPSRIPLVGWADGDSRVFLDWSRADHSVDIDGSFPPTARAIQWRSAQTKAEVFDGWIAVILPPREPEPEEMIDRFCLVGIAGGKEALVRKVRRGYTPGRYTLINHFGDPMHDAELSWFSPILAMKPV